MRIKRVGNTIKFWASAWDTYSWANESGKSWPCSTLSDKRFFAEYNNGDLVDFTVDGRYDDKGEIDGHELNSFIEDFLGSVNPR